MRSKKKRTKVVGNIVVGPPDVEPSTPSHVRGIFQGNHPHRFQRPTGMKKESQEYAEGSARRSTGIRPGSHEVIDPRMPKLSPA